LIVIAVVIVIESGLDHGHDRVKRDALSLACPALRALRAPLRPA